MRVKLNPFPSVFFSGRCTIHGCHLEFQVSGEHSSGGQILPMSCKVGGGASLATCTDDWEIAISGGGDITITKS